MVSLFGKQLTDEQEQQLKIGVILVLAGAGFYFLVYLPDQKRQELEEQIRTDIDQLQNIQSQDYSNHLIRLQNYLKWERGTEIEQSALSNKLQTLNQAIQWLQQEKARYLQERTNETQTELERQKLEDEKKNREKKLHWKRESYNWADELAKVYKSAFNKGWDHIEKIYGNKELPPCPFGAQYTIHFPLNCWNKLTREQKYLSNGKLKPGISLIDKSEDLTFTNQKILEWEKKILMNPTRGIPDSQSGKDNNAIFYGAPGTGKTSIIKRLCLKVNQYPMIEMKGSSLTSTVDDHEAGIQNLQKFIYTISDITWNLVDNFGFTRSTDGEVRYILFVDEANQVEKNTFSKSPTYLVFLKECMEGVNKEKQSKNLWIFATNYLDEVDKAVYRPGRLSNPLDFSWTLGDFYQHAKKVNIYSQFPQHWKEKTVLKKEDNEFVNKFSIKSFHELFLPFWKKFIAHSETQKDLPEIKPESATEEQPAQLGIQLGEFFEFFWKLKESGQLHHFNGKWETPRSKKIEEVMEEVKNTVDVRIDEVNDLLQQIGTSINNMCNSLQTITSSTIQLEIKALQAAVAELQKKVN